MKGLFLVLMSMDNMKKNIIGAYIKVNTQVAELNRHFETEIVDCDFKRNLLTKLISRIPYAPNNFKWPKDRPMPYDADFIYIRADECDMEIYRFIKKIKTHSPDCRIIIEYPNYPLDYDAMIKNISMIPTKYKHFHSQKKLPEYTDRFVTFGAYAVEGDTPTIRIHNMFDYGKQKPRTVFEDNENKDINVISVSGMMNWHRIDRLLEGMRDYCGNPANTRNFYLHLLGTGPQLNNILSLIKEYHLENNVFYYGVKSGRELDDIYDKCELGIEVLSEKGIFSSSLKSREYWGKGLPIITTSHFEPRTEEISKYIYKTSIGADPVDICSIIGFYDRIYSEHTKEQKQQVADEIRAFAVKNYDVSVLFKPVVEYIESGI